VPQDPVLFSGTVRSNLDPFGESYDDEIVHALRKSCMYDYVMTTGGGLGMRVDKNGENFSVGQRQLLCLGRAVLRKARILVCDEHSASIDPLTDRIISDVLRTTFKDATIIAIAHRIQSVMEYDKVMVMGDGKVEEFGNPRELRKVEGGAFKEFCDRANVR